MKKYDVIAIGELNVDLILSGLKSMPIVGQEIIADKSSLAYTDIFFPNETEALHITEKENVQDALDELSKYAKRVIVKCGSMGAFGKYEGVKCSKKRLR
jgi:hypothetical protein